MKKGIYVVLQGVQGVGKTTQIDELERRLLAAGIPTRKMREPDSQTDLTARNLRSMTQNPRYPMNTKTEVLLYNAARSQTLDVVKKMNDRGVSCIVDHCYLTTLAVQYYARGDIKDYDAVNTIIDFTVGDIEPDLIVILDVPVEVSLERLKGRGQGERFDSVTHDFLKRERDGLLLEAKKRKLPIVDATQSIDAIADDIWNLVSETLKSSRSKKPAKAATTNAPTKVSSIIEQKKNPYLRKEKGQVTQITEEGHNYLRDVVTDTEGDVYAFNDTLSPATVAAAMARLSRRGDDMRITLLDEFIGKAGKDEDLLNRVITAYGDDSVQQLAGIHFVVENASNLLTKKLEWGRLAAYLEQSTRYIFFDEKDKNGNFKYYTPRSLDAKTAKQYEESMNTLFTIYSKMVRELTDYVRAQSNVPKAEQDVAWKGATRAQACDAIRPVLPVATKSTVGIFASGQAAESLYMHLMSDELEESRATGESLLTQLRKVTPVFFERADKPARGGASIAYSANTKKAMREIADEKLNTTLSPETEDLTLVDYWPKRELDLVPHMLFEHSSLPLEEIQSQTEKWSYDDRLDVFNAYMGDRLNRRHKPGRAMEQAHYSWEIVCDYGIFRDLQRHRMVDDLAWQELTPRYGYEIPELVEEAGLSDQFERCFDISLELYSLLQAGGFQLEAQYATLLGHRMRWKITYNAREAFHFHELRTAPQGHPGYRKLVKRMHDMVAEVHPQITNAMTFVNKDEDPELTRLAAERYTQFKLNQLSDKS